MTRYSEVERRLKRAAGKRLQPLCSLRGMRWWWLELPSEGNERRCISLTAGIHGDEPAGVEAVLRFLERPRPRWAKGIRFLVFPCMNPYGYERGLRNNYANLDLNRQYRDAGPPEIRAQKRVFGRQWFDLHMTLHEDVDAPGFYIYELSRREDRIAARIVENVSRILPIDRRSAIEGRRAHGGVIRRHFKISRRKHWPEALYAFGYHTDHTLTTETPVGFDIEKRVNAQLTALRTACEFLRSAKRESAA